MDLPYAGYGRVSAKGEREDDKFRSPEFQQQTREAFAAREGITVVDYGTDVDVKGSSLRRATLDRIIEDMRQGKIAGVVVAKLDRLSRLAPRERVELFELIEDELGGRILSAVEPNDVSTPEGRFAREVFLLVARLEWERDADGFKNAKRAAMKNGFAIGPVPFGYDTPNRLYVPVPADEPVVVALFEARRDGASYGTLVELFHTLTGRQVSRTWIARLLTNRAYLGELWYDGELSPVRHLAIVDPELFEDVQAMNQQRRKGRGPDKRQKALLAGSAKCGSCGGPLSRGGTKGGRENTFRQYRCTSDHCSAPVSISERLLDEHVEAKTIEWLGPYADELVEVERELNPVGRRAEAVYALEQARERTDLFIVSPAAARLRADRYEAALNTFHAEEARLEGLLEGLGEEGELARASSTLRRSLQPGAEELTVDERRGLLNIALERVTVFRAARGASVASRVTIDFAETREQELIEVDESAEAWIL